MLSWPRNILAPRKVMVEPVYATVSGGRGITALEQVIASDAGYWAITLDEIPFVSAGQKQVARALSVQLGGRLGAIDVPIYDDQAPFPIVNGLPVKPGTVPFSDGAQFSDTSEFFMDTITASVVGAVALSATMMSINLSVGTFPQPGQHFSIQGATQNRLYRIKTSTLVSGTTYSVCVWPPVREAIADGTSAEFNDPRLTCRLKTDGEMQTFIDDYAGRTLAKVNFEELLP